MVALQMAVESLDGPERDGLAELVAAAQSVVVAGRDRVEALRAEAAGSA